jgi:hypothetical protein
MGLGAATAAEQPRPNADQAAFKPLLRFCCACCPAAGTQGHQAAVVSAACSAHDRVQDTA